MKQLTPEQQADLDRVKAMIWKNVNLLLKWSELSEAQKKKKGSDYINNLIARTEILMRAVKNLEEME